MADSKIDATQLPEGYPRQVMVVGDGSGVEVTTQEGGCSKASVELTSQSDKEVVLTLIDTTPAKQQMCTMDMRYPQFTVKLNAPLADRTLVLHYQQRTS